MRKLVAFTMSIAMLVVVAGVADATHSGGQGPKEDFANGTLHVDSPTFSQDAHINARSDGSGPGADGKIWFRQTVGGSEIEIRADVTCMTVVGNLATAAGPITRSEGLGPAFQTLFLSVQDFGEPGTGPPADRFGVAISTLPPPLVCPTLGTFAAATGGNVVVHNAP